MIQLPWFDLEPIYNASTQSFNQLNAYIDSVKQKEATPPEVESMRLRAAEFDCHLSGRFQEILNKKGLPIIINTNIESLAMDYASAAILFTEREPVPEEALIEICYRGQYPFVADIMQNALAVSRLIDGDEEVPRSYLTQHALFGCIFSNQPLLSFLSEERISAAKTKGEKKENAYELLYLLLMSRSFISLIQQGYIDPDAFFKSITDTTDNKVCKLLEKKVELLHNHAKVNLFAQLHGLLRANPGFDARRGVILDLLFIKNITSFFKVESIRNLYFSGQFTNEDFALVRFNMLNLDSLSGMNERELKSALIAASPDSVTQGARFSLRASMVLGQVLFSAPPEQGLTAGKSAQSDTILEASQVENTYYYK